MNKTELISAVSERTGMVPEDCAMAVKAMLTIISEVLQDGGTIQIPGFGTFMVKERAAGTVCSPTTGERYEYPARKVPSFKAGKTLRDAVM